MKPIIHLFKIILAIFLIPILGAAAMIAMLALIPTGFYKMQEDLFQHDLQNL